MKIKWVNECKDLEQFLALSGITYDYYCYYYQTTIVVEIVEVKCSLFMIVN